MTEFNDLFNFVCFAIEELEKHPPGTKVCFKCPICGKTAHGSKSIYNGHRVARCENCVITFKE